MFPSAQRGWNATLDPTGFNRLRDQLAVEDLAVVQEAGRFAGLKLLNPLKS
jgi:hypothetical protein